MASLKAFGKAVKANADIELQPSCNAELVALPEGNVEHQRSFIIQVVFKKWTNELYLELDPLQSLEIIRPWSGGVCNANLY